MRRSAVIAVLLAAGALAGPSGQRTDQRCAAYCLTAEPSKFSYTPGQTYHYSFISTVDTELTDISDEVSSLRVTANAEIIANSACDFTLRLRDVSLSESEPTLDASEYTRRFRPVDDTSTFKEELERHPLSFSYQDGRVEELCAAQTEPVWVLNFKRGLLSATVNNLVSLQMPESDKYEMDVSGYCSTDYSSLLLDDNTTVISKQKDLRTCRERGRLISSLQGTPYHSASKVQSPPLLRSQHECTQTVSSGRLRSVVCTETHTFEPFVGSGTSGATTYVKLEMTETDVLPTVSAPEQAALTARGSIMFDHSAPALTAQSRVGEAQRLVEELDRLTAEDVRPEVPHLFSQLVTTLRQLDADHLRVLLTDEATLLPRRYMLDALPMLGTATAMDVMRDLMLTGVVAADQSDRWMTSLALVHEPRLAMVEAVAPLVASEAVRSQTLLGVTALVHRFCDRDGDCARHDVVTHVVTSIQNLLGSNCGAETQEGRARVLAALKALGNAGLLVQGNAVLSACFKNQADIEVRLAAIRAYRRMSCETIADSGLMSTLGNQQEDTEVRIAAYLTIMQCPSHGVIDKLLELLEKETVNQVGSFIWTHITNMQETNDPGKGYVKSLLYNAELAMKFNTDVRKFSRYYEKTLFFESVNAGGTVEGNVIFSPDSYVPRSGMLNLTVDLFGDSINLLEVGARVEGLQDYIENLFANGGSYSETAFKNVLNKIRGSASSNDISKLSNIYNQANANAGTFSASTYAKILGNELHFANYDSLEDLIRSLRGDNPFSFLEALGQERDWSDNYQFLDSSYTVPTVAGFPLTLQAVGSASVSMKTGGSFSFESWSKMRAEGYVKPSAAVEIVGRMGVDAHVARTGLKMTTSLHTSTVLDGHAIIDSGKLVSIKINMPRDKVEIFDFKTLFHRVHRNQDIVPRMRRFMVNKYGDCSHPYIGDPLGIKGCFHMSYLSPTGKERLTAPTFPFVGPVTASLTIEKTDPSIEAFSLVYSHYNQNDVRQSSLMFETPGGRQNRRVSLSYMLDIPQQAFQVEVMTPIKSLELRGGLDLTGVEKHANVRLRLDDREVFALVSSLTKDDSAVALRYRPQLVIRGSRGPIFSLRGNLNMNKDKRKYAVDLVISDLYDNPVTLSGTVDETDGIYALSVSMNSYVLKGSLQGSFRYDENEFYIKTKTEYSIFDGANHTIAVNTRTLKEHALEAHTTYKVTVDTKFSALPMLDAELVLELNKGPRQLGGRALLVHGQHQYQLAATLADRRGHRSGMLAFQAQHLDVDFKVALELDMSRKHRFEMTSLAQLKQDRFARGGLVVDYLSESYNFNYGISTYVTLINSNYSLTTGARRDATSSDFEFVASRTSPSENKTVSLTSQLATLESGEHSLEVTLRLPSYPTTQLSGRLAAGAGGRYVASGELRRGARAYLASAEYRYTDQHELQLRAHLPDRQYSGALAARTEGGGYKLKADLRLGRRIMTVLSLRPGAEETSANFELFWNKDVDDTQNIILDLKKTSSQIESRLRYPGRDLKLLAELMPGGAQAVLQLSPKEIISVTGIVTVEDDGRLGATLNVETPFPGYTRMMLTYKNKPDASDERSMLNFQVAGLIEDKEVVLDGRLVVDFNGVHGIGRAKGNTLKAELDFRTPFVGWEMSQLICTYFQDTNDLSARISASKNDDVMALGMVFEKFQVDEVFRINTAVDFALPIDRVRNGKMGFVLMLKDSHIEADTAVEWTSEKPKKLSMNVQCRYNVTSDVWVDLLVTFKTPFANMEQLEAHLKVNVAKLNLTTSFTVKRDTSEELLHTYLNSVSSESPKLFASEFDFACSGCPGFGASLGYQSVVGTSSFNITTHWKEKKTELKGVTRSTEEEGREYSLALLLPNPVRRYFLRSSFHADLDNNMLTNSWEVSRDNQTVKIDMSSVWTIESHAKTGSSYSVLGEGRVTSPFLGWESARISHKGSLVMNDTAVDLRTNVQLNKEDKHIVVDQSGTFYNWTSWIFQHEITSNAGWFSRVNEIIKLDLQKSSRQAICRTTWDGQTAQLALVDDQSHNGDYDLFVTTQWFGQPQRRLSLTMPSTPAAWTPSLAVLYAPGKTIKMHGSIAHVSTAAESHLTIETPFTDVLALTIRHDFIYSNKYALVELLHGQDKYNLRADVDTRFPLEATSSVKFSSPSNFVGSGGLRINYLLANSFVLNGELSHNDWKVSLTSSFGKREGGVVILTPLKGFTELSLTYTVAPKAVQLRLSYDQRVSSLVLTDESDYDVLKYTAQLTTPYRGFELLTMSFDKPRGKIFSIHCHQNRQRKVTISGSYELSGPQSHVQIEVRTVFDALRNARLEFGYNLPKPSIKLLIAKAGDVEHTMKFEASTNLSVVSSTMKASYQNSGLIFGPRSIVMTAVYDVQDYEKRLDLELLDGDKTFSVKGRAQLSTASSYLTIDVDSPIPDYKTLSFSSKASSLPGGPKLTFELVRNNQTIEAELEIAMHWWNGHAVFEMTTPFTINRQILLSAAYHLQNNSVGFELNAERNSVRKTISLKGEFSYSELERCRNPWVLQVPHQSVYLDHFMRLPCKEFTAEASLTTPFHGLEELIVKGKASIEDTKYQAELMVGHDQDQVTTEAYGQIGWSSSEVSILISTPLASRNIGLNATYDIGSTTKTVSVSLFNNGRKLEWLASGTVQSKAANGFMTILTPFATWKSVNFSAMYDLNRAEKQMDISFERNGQKQTFASRGFYNASSISLNAVTPFKGFETLGIGGRYVNNRAKREVGYHAHINEESHRLYLSYERDGKNNIKLRLNTPIHGLHAVEVDLRGQSFSDGVGIYLEMNTDGKRGSAEVRTSLGRTTMGIDATFQSDWEGFEDVKLSGSVNFAKRKKAFRLASESKKNKIELSGFYALNKKGGIGKLVSKLPFPGLEKVNVKVKVTTGKKNKLLLTYTAGGKKKKIIGDLTFTDSSININLKTPYNGFQRIRVNVGRTTAADGKVSAELSLKRDNREITVKYAYIFSRKSGDGNIEISTPYEGFEDMRMSLNYNNQAKQRNMKFNARRNSREWSIESSRSWADGTDETSLVLSSPIESIRSLKVHRSFDIQNLAAMKYDASYERNNRKFVISGEGSIITEGKQVTLDVTIDTPLEIGQLSANVAYDFTSTPSSLNAGVKSGTKYMTLLASLGKPTGSIKLTTSHPTLPTIDIDYTTRTNDFSKDVSATVTLADGRRLSVAHKRTQSQGGSSGSIKIDSTTFGNRELKWEYNLEKRRAVTVGYSMSSSYMSPGAQVKFDYSMAMGSWAYRPRKVDASFSIASERLTKTIKIDSTFNFDNIPEIDASVLITVDGRAYKLVISREVQRGQRTLNISFDGQRIKGLKFVGSASSPLGSLEGQRTFTITYGGGSQAMSLKGSVDLGTSGKSGSLELLLNKPSRDRSAVKEISLKTTWSFILPNRRIQTEFSVDGRGYVAKFGGSRYTKKADYVLEVSFPNVRLSVPPNPYSPPNPFSDVVMSISYDLNDGVHAKVQIEKPLEGTAEVNFKKSNLETALKTLFTLNDNNDISPKIGLHRFDLIYRKTKTSVGSAIQTSLDTTAFDLGKIDVNADIQRTPEKSIINIDYKRGTKTAKVSGEISRAPGSGSSAFSLKAPIVGFEDVNLSGNYEYSPGQKYSLNIDYSRAGKHFRLDTSSAVSIKRAKGKMKSVSTQTSVQVSSLITRPVELSFTADVSITNPGTRTHSGTGKLEGTLNGKKVSLNYKVDRDDHGRRIASAVLTTPLKNPYRKIVINSDVSLHSNRAELSVQAGSRMLSADVSWFAGEAGQYGIELSLSTPYAVLKSLELEVRGTRNRDRSVDVLGHYQRNGVMVHVSGNVRPYAIDLFIEAPWGRNYRLEGGVELNRQDRVYSVRGLASAIEQNNNKVTTAGGEITVKTTALNDLQLIVDAQTPFVGWERFNVALAYTSLDVPFSRVIRVGFETPQTKRVELSLELTNRSGDGKTDLRAGATINYQTFGFTFGTHIFRDPSGMKYELELESPYHVNLPMLSHHHHNH